MLNALTVDVEDFFHVEALASTISRSSWDTFPPRVEQNVARILEIFAESKVRATFFILGWVAERFAGLVRSIADSGHEIGSHGHSHQRIHTLTPSQFRSDLRASRNMLADQVQHPIIAYRAPSFSIVKGTLWALDILAEEGFQIDSSIFPVRHDLYGIPGACRLPHLITTSGGNSIFEFPPSTASVLGNEVGIAGGGYLRIFPYAWTQWGIRRLNDRERQPAMVYFHPWELDPGQPRYGAPWSSRFRHYTNLGTMEKKIRRLLTDFQFDTVSAVCTRLESFNRR